MYESERDTERKEDCASLSRERERMGLVKE